MNDAMGSPGPPVMSHIDERELLEELGRAAEGKMDFRTPVKGKDRAMDRSLLPYMSVFEARSTPDGAPAPQLLASPSNTPSVMDRKDEIEAESLLDISHAEVTYAQVMADLVQSENFEEHQGNLYGNLRGAIVELEGFCLKQSFKLQEMCEKIMHNSLKHLSYQNAAAEMRQEAATWCLMRHLFFERPLPDPADDPNAVTSGLGCTRAHSVLSNPSLVDAANVVSWLEYLAALDLDANPSKLPTVGSGDGIWRETKLESSLGNKKVVSQMDPDAVTREKKDLNRDNARDEGKLMRIVWHLVRAGRVRDACNICKECGQPWRAASIASAGVCGPTPVGEVALSQLVDPTAEDREYETLADEFSMEPGLRRFLWKMSCHAVSESAIIDSVNASDLGSDLGGAKSPFEAAVYASLCGNIQKIIPVCNSWEDVLWAYYRSVLEHGVDVAIDQSMESRGPQHKQGIWFERMAKVYPESNEAIFGLIDNIGEASIAQERDHVQRRIQRFLILKEYNGLLLNIRNWVLHPDDHMQEEFSFAEPPASPPMMRFAAHAVLFLRFMGLLTHSEEEEKFSEHQDIVNKVLQVYIIHLMDTEQHDLIPVYAAHLRDTSLDLTYMIFLDEMMRYSLIEQQKCYALACKYLGEAVPRLVCKYASKIMREVEGFVEDTAEQRASATLWLCNDEYMYPSALRHSVLLCRNFAFGGMNCSESASTLLVQILPEEFWKWMSNIQFESNHGIDAMEMGESGISKGLLAASKEIEDWKAWYSFQDSFEKWRNLCTILESDSMGKSVASLNVESLNSSDAQTIQGMGERLLDEALKIATSSSWLEPCRMGSQDKGVDMYMVCQAVPKPAGMEGAGFGVSEVLSGDFDPVRFEVALNQSFNTHGGKYIASVKPSSNSSCFELHIQSRSGEDDNAPGSQGLDMGALAYTIGWAIKGNLSKELQDVGLYVQHTDCGDNEELCLLLCRQMCLSRLLLQCVYIRQFLSGFEEVSPRSEDLIELVAGICNNMHDYSQYFTPFQLQEVVLMERETVINELERKSK